MPPLRRIVRSLVICIPWLASCHRAPPVTAPAAPVARPSLPAAAAAPAAATPGLPPIPWVHGTLALDVVYPGEHQLVSVRDSTLTINGVPVSVRPNGSFLAFLAVPADTAYALEAFLPNGERARMVRRIRYPAPLRGPR